MNPAEAFTWKSRLLFRISTDPTASARALRAVIEQHKPDQIPESSHVVCADCLAGPGIPVSYPCATKQVIAMELGVPLPEPRAYDALTDG
jgi:hypothetical protein